MSFIFNCEFCNAKMKVEESWIGKQAECPVCKNYITISKNIAEEKIESTVEETFLFKCSECGSIKPLDIKLLGQKIDCPCCAEEVIAEKALTKTCLFCGNQIKINATVCKFCKKSVDSFMNNQNLNSSSPLSNTPTSNKQKNQFLYAMFFAWWLSMAILYPLGIGFSFIPKHPNFTIFQLMTIPTTVFFFILIFNYWKIILPIIKTQPVPEELNVDNVTPGKAIGFCFIPFFNLYWVFVAFNKLGNILKYITKSNKNHFSFGYSISLCFTLICSFISSIFYIIWQMDRYEDALEIIYNVSEFCCIGISIWNLVYHILMVCALNRSIKNILSIHNNNIN